MAEEDAATVTVVNKTGAPLEVGDLVVFVQPSFGDTPRMTKATAQGKNVFMVLKRGDPETAVELTTRGLGG